MPLLVDIDTGWGGAFNIARTVRSLRSRSASPPCTWKTRSAQKRCGHRPGKEVVTKDEMVDRVKAAVDARTDADFVIMARTDAAAVEGVDAAIERAVAYVEAGADMIFPEAMYDARRLPALQGRGEGADPGQPHRVRLDAVLHHRRTARRRRRHRAVSAAARIRAMNKAALNFYETRAPRRHAEEHRRHAADARRAVRLPRLPRLRRQARRAVRARSKNEDDHERRPRHQCCPKAKKSVALSGTAAGNTALCTVGRSGNDLHYRGYDIQDLATQVDLRGSRAPAGARRAADRRRS